MTKGYKVLFLLLCSVCGSAWAADAVEQVKQTLNAYEQAWSRHDAAAVASFYYEPAMRVTAGGPVVRKTRAEQQSFFTGFLAGLVERGYDRSVWEELNVHLLDENTAIASGVTVRYRANGELFERVAVTYALWRTPEGWRIFLTATHTPESVLRRE